MAGRRIIKTARKWHKWPGLIISIIAIHFALSGIILNHRTLVSGVDVSRNWLPENYAYKNWNMAAIRGGFDLGHDSLLVYGNTGCWLKSDTSFLDFNTGFPKGIDNRKVVAIHPYKGNLVAATPFGLFERGLHELKWNPIQSIENEARLVDIFTKQDTLIILTRDRLFKTTDLKKFDPYQLPSTKNHRQTTGLFKTLWELHSGELWGFVGKLLVDFLGFITIFLCLSGMLHFFFPGWMKRRKKRKQANTNHARVFKWNLRYHNKIGYIFVFFLLINTLAGMFLRPPLLIPILHKNVAIIPGTHLDTPNPWADKLRKGAWNEDLQQYVFSTSDGFYLVSASLQNNMIRCTTQPPVSIMGCNVLIQTGPEDYLVGSFSGLYHWSLKSGRVVDFLNPRATSFNSGNSRPVSDHMVSGFIQRANKYWYFDYKKGMVPISASEVWQMPERVKKASPMSLWNLALEMHTGRIFEFAIGLFYFLYVPLAGLCLLAVYISGFLIWYFAYRKKRRPN